MRMKSISRPIHLLSFLLCPPETENAATFTIRSKHRALRQKSAFIVQKSKCIS